MTIAKRMRKPVELDAAGMVAKIKTQVQAYASTFAQVQRDTPKLALLVSAAFMQLKKENERATKLDFCQLFATKEQLVDWPEKDMDAKAPGSPVQSLFNGIEYLLSKARRLTKLAENELAQKDVLDEATRNAKHEIVVKGLKGEDAKAYIETAKSAALATLTGTSKSTRVPQEDVAQIIHQMWYSELDDFEVFKTFVSQLLALKYADATVVSIVSKAEILIAAEQVKEDTPVAEQPAALPATVTQFRTQAAAAA